MFPPSFVPFPLLSPLLLFQLTPLSVSFLLILILLPPPLSSSFRCPGLAVFPGSREAPQSVWAGGQLSRGPFCARCAGWQPELVFLAGCWQCCNSLRCLRSGCHEPNQTAQTGDQETWGTHHLFSGPALLKDQPGSIGFSISITDGWLDQTMMTDSNVKPTLCQGPFSLRDFWAEFTVASWLIFI